MLGLSRSTARRSEMTLRHPGRAGLPREPHPPGFVILNLEFEQHKGDMAVAAGRYSFTSESVSMGHPDKLADQISDGVLDAIFAQDPHSRVACETLVTTGLVLISGEITTTANVEYAQVARDVIKDVGYTDDQWGICADTCAVLLSIDRQSPDIAMGVDANAVSGKGLARGTRA